MSDFRSEARRWLAAEPDEDMREELEGLLAGPDDELSVRFDGRLQFGTAGLRAAVGAGPQRMNRLVVQQAAAGLADYLLKSHPDAATRGVIIGYDARRKSDAFALDTFDLAYFRAVARKVRCRFETTRCAAQRRVCHGPRRGGDRSGGQA